MQMLTKRSLILMLVVLVVITAAVTFTSAQLMMVPQAKLQLATSYRPPAAPTQQVVYKLTPRFKSQQDVVERARTLGLPSQALSKVKRLPNGFVAEGPKWQYTVDLNKQLESLVSQDLIKGKALQKPFVPDEQLCRQVAEGFIGSKHLVMGGPDEELRYERTNEILRATYWKADGGKASDKPRVLAREIVYCKFVKGVPVTGPGAHVSVMVGDRGEVLAYTSDWMPAVATKTTLPVAKPDTAPTLLRERVSLANQQIPNRKFAVKNVVAKLAKYNLRTVQTRSGDFILVPAFKFEGELEAANREKGPMVTFAPAVSNPSALEAVLKPGSFTLERTPPKVRYQPMLKLKPGLITPTLPAPR